MPSPWSAHRHHSLPRPSAADPAGHRHLAVRPAVFDRVVEQVLEHLRQFVAVALHLAAGRPAALGRCGCRARRRAIRGRAPPPRTSGASRTPPVGGRCSFSSMRDSDSRSSTSRVMRPACSRMMPRKRSRASASSRAGPSSVSIKPTRVASGVFSSCPALAMKSARICSAALQRRHVVQRQDRRRAVERRAALGSFGRAARNARAAPARPAPTTPNSTLRAASPASTASAAASNAGLRSAAGQIARFRYRADKLGRGSIGTDDAALAVDQDQRVRHRGYDRLGGGEPRLAARRVLAPAAIQPLHRRPDRPHRQPGPAPPSLTRDRSPAGPSPSGRFARIRCEQPKPAQARRLMIIATKPKPIKAPYEGRLIHRHGNDRDRQNEAEKNPARAQPSSRHIAIGHLCPADRASPVDMRTAPNYSARLADGATRPRCICATAGLAAEGAQTDIGSYHVRSDPHRRQAVQGRQGRRHRGREAGRRARRDDRIAAKC